jgi:acyl carrier protein
MDVNTSTTIDIDAVKAVVVETLHVEDRAEAIGSRTPLFGSLPELDSMAVMALLLELEERFGIVIEADDVTAEVFETLETLAAFIEDKLR